MLLLIISTLIAQQPDSLIQSLQALKSSLNTDEERAQVYQIKHEIITIFLL